jgi:hypothetical protein
MADPNIFGNLFSSMTGMGNPLSQNKNVMDDYEKELLSKMDPTLAGAIYLTTKRQKESEDPVLFGQMLDVALEKRGKEAERAAKIQAERDKRAFQYQLAASIPKTITQLGSNLAQMAYNAPRLQILADTPGKILQGYGALPRINIPDFR